MRKCTIHVDDRVRIERNYGSIPKHARGTILPYHNYQQEQSRFVRFDVPITKYSSVSEYIIPKRFLSIIKCNHKGKEWILGN
jgi:hypothetical protein